MQFLLLVLTLLIPLNLSERVQRVRSVTCGSSLKSVKDPFCQLKSSRQDTLVTLSMTLLRKISDGVISYKVDRVSTYELKTLLDLKDVQICSFIESGKFLSSVPIVGNLFNYVKNFKTNILEVCTSIQKIYLTNLSFNGFEMAKLFPAGTYVTYITFYDFSDKNIYSVNTTIANVPTKTIKKTKNKI